MSLPFSPRTTRLNCSLDYRLYFPPVPEASQPAPTDPESTTGGADEAAQEAEAEKVASKLPDVPKADPDSEHADKKQKHDT